MRDFDHFFGKYIDLPFDNSLFRKYEQCSRNTPSKISYDSKETEAGLVMTFDFPGVKKEDIDINVTDNKLNVSGKRDERTDSLSFTFPSSYDEESIAAKLDLGVLTLTIKEKPKENKKITVE